MRILSFVALLFLPSILIAAPPTVIDSRLTLELVASQPDIVTPTGLAIDSKGRIWCIENHTHQRSPSYKGPPTDRVRVFEDFDASGTARKIWTFADGFRNSMGLTFGSDRVLYLATRDAIHRMSIADDKETSRKVIVKLETKGDYPHNGLSGFAWDLNGDLIFGLGENLGEAYKLIGSDGTTLSGGGEGGSMYRCRPDGSHLSRICTGFWNPFAHCVDSKGRLFVVDNDPDARGPCRLLHAVQGGDFGYRFRYGRKGIHPFVCWNGELPGTLPMVAGTSEAPSGVLEWEQGVLPDDYHGKLFVTSWGDHTIEAFELSPRGASYSAMSKTVVRGNENFRPVAIASAPDGSLVFNDWVDKSYPVHGKGRIWRLRAKQPGKPRPAARLSPPNLTEAEWFSIAQTDPSPEKRMNAILMLKSPEVTKRFISTLADPDPFLRSAALEALGKPGNSKMLLASLSGKPQPALRLGILLALRRTGDGESQNSIGQFLADDDPSIRRAAIQWAAEETLKQFKPAIETAAFKPPVTRELLEAWAKAGELLSDVKLPKNLPESADMAIFQRVLSEKTPPRVMAIGLRMLPADSPLIHPGFFERFVRSDNEELVHEILLTALFRPHPRTLSALKSPLEWRGAPEQQKLATVGLALFADGDESVQQMLIGLLSHEDLRFDALRSLRGVTKQADAIVKWWDNYAHGREPAQVDRDLMDQYYMTLRSDSLGPKEKTRTIDEWRTLVKTGDGDARAGERVFFHPKGPGCYKCHRVDNRGGMVGPDLSLIGRASTRDKLIESILEPSKEIAPMFTAYSVLTRDGKQRVGLILGETFDSFVLIGDAQGKVEKIHRTQIEERTAQTKSLMPDDLAQQMTKREFLDLLAFLLERK